jgi:murein DD-endopeptidase MepM/ murein hydrolase activator NlpD
MITVLQRQNVSRRTVPPVAARARSNGVRWSNREITRPLRERSGAELSSGPPDEFGITTYSAPVRLQALRTAVAHAQPARRERGRPQSTHSFLQRQIVRVKRKREKRKGERRWARIIQRAAAPSTHGRPGASLGEQVRHSRDTRTRRPGGALRRIVHSPWLYVALACLAGLAVAAPGLGGTGLSFGGLGIAPVAAQKPVLPAPQEADPVLYALAVPDMPGPSAADLAAMTDAPTTVIAGLKVTSYRTQAGDTLSRIASRVRLNVDTIVSWNGIRDGRSLQPGTILSIPNADGLKYVVHRGDTLQGIARSSGVDFNGVLDWNRLASSVITVGQELFLPGARMNANELSRVLGNLFLYPVLGRISSYFGERPDPFTGVANYHNGIDIVNRPGTAIRAAMGGTVADIGFNYNYGNYVILKHSGQYQTLYGHLTRYLVGRGQKVQQGETIGELGTTGYSTGPHLHFSIFHNGQPVDPLRFLK